MTILPRSQAYDEKTGNQSPGSGNEVCANTRLGPDVECYYHCTKKVRGLDIKQDQARDALCV